MIHVRRPRITDLPVGVRTALESPHDLTNVRSAWDNFRRTVAGRGLADFLRAVFHSKCAYCEKDNVGTVDHFYPKERHRSRAFRWGNLLLSCADCNQAKGGSFPLDGRRPRFINPTQDDPVDFFTWDLSTGAMVPVNDPERTVRATFTRGRLHLDTSLFRDQRLAKVKRILGLLRILSHPKLPAELVPETCNLLEEELRPERPNLAIVRFLFFPTIVDDHYTREIEPTVNAIRQRLPALTDWLAHLS